MTSAHNPPAASEHGQSLKREQRIGLVCLGVLLAGSLSWSAMAPVSGAVIAMGSLRPVAQRTSVLAGSAGVVQRWAVREGESVQAGQVLAVLDDPDASAQREALAEAEAGERLRVARLRHLARWQPGSAAPSLAPESGAPDRLLAEETRLLQSTWQQQQASLSQLDRQLREAAARARALDLASQADSEALVLAREELSLNEPLARDGFVSPIRLLALRRSVQEAEGRLQAQRGVLGEARDRQAELSGLRQSEPLRLARDNARDLAEAERRLAELASRRTAAEARWQKLTLRAPVAGRVIDVRPLAPGSVVGAGQALLDLLPADQRLRVQAQVRPDDIAQIHVGSLAEVRITAFASRDTPMLAAKVVLVGSDRSSVVDSLGGSAGGGAPAGTGFAVWLELAPTPLTLSPGMEAEVFITTAARTPLDYWLTPLTRLWQRAARER